jgi:hypothetical protein
MGGLYWTGLGQSSEAGEEEGRVYRRGADGEEKRIHREGTKSTKERRGGEGKGREGKGREGEGKEKEKEKEKRDLRSEEWLGHRPATTAKADRPNTIL